MILCPQTQKQVNPESCREKRHDNWTLNRPVWRDCVHCTVDLGVKPKKVGGRKSVRGLQDRTKITPNPAPPTKTPRKRYLSFMGGRTANALTVSASPETVPPTVFTEVQKKCRQSSAINRQGARLSAGPNNKCGDGEDTLNPSDGRAEGAGRRLKLTEQGNTLYGCKPPFPPTKTKEGRATGEDAPRLTPIVESGWIRDSVAARLKKKPQGSTIFPARPKVRRKVRNHQGDGKAQGDGLDLLATMTVGMARRRGRPTHYFKDGYPMVPSAMGWDRHKRVT